MSGLFGWYNYNHAQKQSDFIVKDMSGTTKRYPTDEPWTSHIVDNAALSCSGSVLDQDGISVAIYGNPHWTNKELQTTANERGNAFTLLQSYKKYDRKVLDQLSGEFTIVIINQASKKAFVAIDRIGVHQLYFSLHNDTFLFSSTAGSILRYPGIKNKISNQAIYDYIYFHMIPTPNCIFEGIEKIPGGHWVEFSDGSVTVERYWQPTFSEKNSTSIEELGSELQDLIQESVKRSYTCESTGSFLSGGLDSSTVSGMLAKVAKGKANTFTIGFDEEGYDETEFARVAVKHFDTNQHEYYVTPEDVIDTVPTIAASYDEPFGNSSVLPSYYCAKFARESGMTHMLAGDGGDELFGGNVRYTKQDVFELYQRVPTLARKGIVEPIFTKLLGNSSVNLLQKVRSYIDQANTPLPDRLQTYNFLHQYSPSQIFEDDFLETIDTKEPIKLLQSVYSSAPNASTLNKMLYLDWQQTLHDNDLVKVNKMCELAGINVTYPLLDDKIVDFSCSLPSNIKIKDRQLRWFYKQAIANFLPGEIINKSKHGFGLPFGVWTYSNKKLQSLAYDNVNSMKSRHYFKSDFIDKAIDMHRTGHAAYYGELVWIIMMLELWFKESCD